MKCFIYHYWRFFLSFCQIIQKNSVFQYEATHQTHTHNTRWWKAVYFAWMVVLNWRAFRAPLIHLISWALESLQSTKSPFKVPFRIKHHRSQEFLHLYFITFSFSCQIFAMLQIIETFQLNLIYSLKFVCELMCAYEACFSIKLKVVSNHHVNVGNVTMSHLDSISWMQHQSLHLSIISLHIERDHGDIVQYCHFSVQLSDLTIVKYGVPQG